MALFTTIVPLTAPVEASLSKSVPLKNGCGSTIAGQSGNGYAKYWNCPMIFPVASTENVTV
jgi:hypothetical protein